MNMKPVDMMRYPKYLLVLLPVMGLSFLLGTLMGNGTTATAQGAIGAVSFQSPEEVVTSYLEAVAEGDVPAIMQTFAAEEMGENFRFDLYVDRLRSLNIQSPAPSDYAFYTDINEVQTSSQLLFQTRNMAYGLLVPETELKEGQTIFIDSEETIDFATSFAIQVDPGRLAQLQVEMIAIPRPDAAQSPRHLENSDRIARVYGADELADRVALLSFEGSYYYVGFILIRYGEDWKINTANSPLGGTSALGFPVQTTVAEFQELVAAD